VALSDVPEKCPQCAAPLPVAPNFPTWYAAYEWGMAVPEQERACASTLDSHLWYIGD
jgi:hypothetical protein